MASAEAIIAERARKNLGFFSWYLSERTPARHHIEWMKAILDPDVNRVLIVAPRESAKTFLSVYTMAWWIGHKPQSTNIICSVSSQQASDRLDMLKQLIELPRYKNVFPYVYPDKQRPYNTQEMNVWASRWPGSNKDITYNSYRTAVATHGDPKNPTVFAAGITSSKIIGRRFNGIALVDDPHDSKNSATEDQRLKVEKFFNENILGGVQAGGKVVVITTRWAETDLAGKLMDKRTMTGEPVWKVIDTPAISPEGESYWPEYWPLDKLQAKREEVGDIMFETMYMNNPIGMSAGLFKPEHLANDLPGELPEFDKVVVSTDMALSKNSSSDYTVIAVIARDKRKPFGYYLLHMFRDRVNFDEGLQEVARMCDFAFEKYGRLDNVLFELPFALPWAEELKARRPDLPVLKVAVKGDKATRLGGVAVKAQAKLFYVNMEMPTYHALRSEFLGFPKAAHDDICDAVALPLQLDSWHYGLTSSVQYINSPYLL
jgi:predicted phage terminase large subunit-like protein